MGLKFHIWNTWNLFSLYHFNALNGRGSIKYASGSYTGLFCFSTSMQISSSDICECEAWVCAPGSGCGWLLLLLAHSPGRGSGKLRELTSLKWLLALLPKIGEWRADRETSGICSNFHNTLQFQTKFLLTFLFHFWHRTIKKKKIQTNRRSAEASNPKWYI